MGFRTYLEREKHVNANPRLDVKKFTVPDGGVSTRSNTISKAIVYVPMEVPV
jgi:hypothetical protein